LPIDLMERLHWRVLVEKNWEPGLSQVARQRIPKELHGQDRIDFYKARTHAQEVIAALFPSDEET
jgi:hypothetical protein